MRRTDRQVTDLAVIRDLLSRSRTCTLSLVDEEGEPYGVILSYGFSLEEDGRLALYFHSATEGHKMDVLRQNSRAAFSLFCDAETLTADLPCDYSSYYGSVVGVGNVFFLEAEADKIAALDCLMANHGAQTQGGYKPSALARIAVLRLDVERYTAKRHTAKD